MNTKDKIIKQLEKRGDKPFKPCGRPSFKLNMLLEYANGICQVKKNTCAVASFIGDARK